MVQDRAILTMADW